MENYFDSIGEMVNRSASYWEGQAGEAHRREYTEYLEEIKESLARFKENIIDLQKIAGIYRQNEQVATEIGSRLPADLII